MRNHSLWVPGEYCRAAETYRNSRKGTLVASCILRQNMAIYILHSMFAVDMAMATPVTSEMLRPYNMPQLLDTLTQVNTSARSEPTGR